jgi:patatin-like phospholipase/acyl hydrolase
MPGTARILAIDGGGIRGIIPAVVMDRIERRTGQPIAHLFHMIAGTSTGGILALGLTKPGAGGNAPAMTAADAIALYRDRGEKIFSRSLWKGFSSLGGLADEKYDEEDIEEVLEDALDDTWLSEALADVLVTTYDLEAREPHFFKSWKARGEDLRAGETAADRDVPIRHAARATSAAPTYFEPAPIQNRSQNARRCLVDGGVYANNPAQCALASARKIYPKASRYLVVSLGTGLLERPIPCQDAKGWGLLGWARPVLNIIFDGVSDTVDYQLAEALGRTYYRFETDLRRFPDGTRGPNDDLDDASPENTGKLTRKAHEMMAVQSQKLGNVIRQLKKPKAPRADLS